MFRIRDKKDLEGVLVSLTHKWDNYVIQVKKDIVDTQGFMIEVIDKDTFYESEENNLYEFASIEIISGEMTSLFISSVLSILSGKGYIKEIIVTTDDHQANLEPKERSFIVYLNE